ncbi:hypothetical protein M9458_015256, partial [Cirrhinus mrigala]
MAEHTVREAMADQGAPIQNRESRVASSSADIVASPQNSAAYSTNGRSLWVKAEKRAATSKIKRVRSSVTYRARKGRTKTKVKDLRMSTYKD